MLTPHARGALLSSRPPYSPRVSSDGRVQACATRRFRATPRAEVIRPPELRAIPQEAVGSGTLRRASPQFGPYIGLSADPPGDRGPTARTSGEIRRTVVETSMAATTVLLIGTLGWIALTLVIGRSV